MKHKALKIGASVLVCVMLLSVFAFSLVTYSDSTGNDPLVTLSYLTDVLLPQFKKDVLMEVAKTEGGTSTSTTPTQGNETAANGAYTLLELENGAKLYTNSTLEFIVRPGSDVAVISPFAEQGIADITNGIEYLDGASVPYNAYCLIPRGSDGRGIEVLNDKSYILVRGEYYIG